MNKEIKLRPYQEAADNAVKNFLDQEIYKRAVIVAPTGSGKSILIAKAAEKVKTPVLILQPSKELLEQNYEKYTNNGFEASIYSASLKVKEIGHVTFATPKSIVASVDKLVTLGVKTAIIDECHLQTKSGSINHSIIRTLEGKNNKNKVKTIGYTATPVILRNTIYGAQLSLLNRTHDSIFQDIIHVTQIKDIKDEFWTPLKYQIYQRDESSLILNSNGSDYTEKSLERFFYENNFLEEIPKKVKELSDRKLIVIFAPSVVAAQALGKLIPDSAVFYSGMDMKVREQQLNSIKKGTTRTAINVNILAVGWDESKVDTEILLRPTNSIGIYYQHIGRAVRLPKPGETKLESLILDYSGNVNRFGPVEDISFEKDPVHGWGMFNGDRLLTGYPMNAPPKFKSTRNLEQGTIKLWFGRYINHKVDELPRDYIDWLLNKSGWEWKGEKMLLLKSELLRVYTGQLSDNAFLKK